MRGRTRKSWPTVVARSRCQYQVEVQRVRRRIAERVVDVVEDEIDVLAGVVGQQDSRRSTERHRDRRVERAALGAREERVLEWDESAEARAEKVAERRRDGRGRRAIPGNIWRRTDRSISGERSFTVIQMRRMMPAP